MLKPWPILCAFSDNLQPVEEKSPQEQLKNGDLVEPEDKIFSRVLRDSISRFVGPSVGRLVGQWSPFDFFGAFKLLGLTVSFQKPF